MIEIFKSVSKLVAIVSSIIAFLWATYEFNNTHDLYYGVWAIIFFMIWTSTEERK